MRTILFNGTLWGKNGFKPDTDNAAGPLPLFQIYGNNETKRYQPEFQEYWFSYSGSEYKLLMEIFYMYGG